MRSISPAQNSRRIPFPRGESGKSGKLILLLIVGVGGWSLWQPANVYYTKYRLESKAADAIRDAKHADPEEMKRVMMRSIQEIGANVTANQVQVRSLGEGGAFEITVTYVDTLDYKFTQEPVQFTIREKQTKTTRDESS